MQVVSWLSFQYKHNVIHQFHSSEEVKYNFLPSTGWVSSLIKSSFLHDDCSFLKHTFHPLTPTLIKFQYNLVPSPSSLPIFPVLPILYISLTSSFPIIKELLTPHSLKLKNWNSYPTNSTSPSNKTSFSPSLLPVLRPCQQFFMS